MEKAITSADHSLVREGWCWWYRKYAPCDVELEKLDEEARDAKNDLWAEPQAGAPVRVAEEERVRSFFPLRADNTLQYLDSLCQFARTAG